MQQPWVASDMYTYSYTIIHYIDEKESSLLKPKSSNIILRAVSWLDTRWNPTRCAIPYRTMARLDWYSAWGHLVASRRTGDNNELTLQSPSPSWRIYASRGQGELGKFLPALMTELIVSVYLVSCCFFLLHYICAGGSSNCHTVCFVLIRRRFHGSII